MHVFIACAGVHRLCRCSSLVHVFIVCAGVHRFCRCSSLVVYVLPLEMQLSRESIGITLTPSHCVPILSMQGLNFKRHMSCSLFVFSELQ